MRILIYMGGGFDTHGPSNHLYETLIDDLLLKGHTVHLIESHSSGNLPDIPEKLIDRKNFSFEIVKLKVIPKKAFAKRYLAGVKYCIDSIPALNRCYKDYDVMMVQSCPWAPIALSIVKKYVNIPTVWNIQDMFPGASIANGAMPKKWMQKIFYKFHKIAYHKADYIIVISDDMKNKVIEQGVSTNKLAVIPDWYDDTSIKEIPWNQNLFVKKYNMKKDCFYVQFAGTMGFNFDYKMVVEVAKRLKHEENIVFQMVGEGSQKDIFASMVKKENLSNIIFLPLEPQEMVSHVYSACSICLIPLPKGVIGNSVPSKAGLLMGCRRVIVTSSDGNSEYNKMLNDNKIGFACSSDDPDKLAEMIITLKNDDSLRLSYANNAYTFAKKYYARSRNTLLYEKVFKKVMEEIK